MTLCVYCGSKENLMFRACLEPQSMLRENRLEISF